MGVDAQTHRARVGNFNNIIASYISYHKNTQELISFFLTYGIHIWFLCLIILSGDIHPNPGPKSNLVKGFLLNTRSIKRVNSSKNKIAEFQALVTLKKPMIICLTETWLNPTISNQEILSEDLFTIYRKDRASRGGGVLTAIHNSIKSKIRTDLMPKDDAHNEILVVEIKFPKLPKCALVNMYRPPNDNDKSCVENLNKCLSKIRRAGFKNICLLGDLNLPNLDTSTGIPKNNSFNCELFQNTFNNFDLKHLIKSPTHKNGNTLDLILSNFPDKLKKIYIESDSFDSDHYLVNFSLNLNHKIPDSKPRFVYNYKRADWEGLKHSIQNSNLNDVIDSSDDIDQICTSWTDILTGFIKNHIPTIKIKNVNTPPWIDGDILKLSKKKENARQKALRLDTEANWNKLKKLRNQLKSLINKKYSDYINDVSLDASSKPKRFWGLVKNKTKSRHIPDSISYKNKTETDSSKKADLFNSFFFDNFTLGDGDELPAADEFINLNLSQIVVSVAEVRLALSTLDPSKATGPDDLSCRILKECAAELAPSLTKLLNKSLQLGKVPDIWKRANVVPVHKKGDKSAADNYRPISLLCITSKILERCIYNKIFPHIKFLLSKVQHGFLKGRSTTTQLLLVLCELINNMENGFQTDIIYLDFSKAFDSVCHKLLILKLKTFGFNGPLLNWFSSYLTGRKQRVVLEGSSSEWLPVHSGVPQGSILGPLLFLLFVNDMPEVLSDNTKISLFADDAKLYHKIENITDSLTLQRDLNNLINWSKIWKLKFNASKCKILAINNTNPLLMFNYSMNSVALSHVDSFNDLGLTINSTLNWTDHISNKISKANSIMGLIKRTLGYRCPMKPKLLLYNSLVKSNLAYGSVIWAYGSKTNLKRVESIQRNATKYITNDYTSDYKTRLRKAEMIPFSYSKEIADICFLYKCFHHLYDIDISTVLNFYDRSQSRTRQGDRPLSLIPYPNKPIFCKDFFTRRIIKTWNGLPASVISIIPTNNLIFTFKRLLKTYYLEKLDNTFQIQDTCTWRTFCPCGRC